MLAATDIRGVYAIMPTPANADAARPDAVDTVDLEETARLADQMIVDGVDGLIALGTTGECATLTSKEYHDVVDCLLTTVRGRVPIFIGTTTLGTHETVARAKFARGQKADGTLLGLPMWQPMRPEAAARFYAGVSEALPDFPIMVYANTNAFRNDFGVEFWRHVAATAPTVTSAKFLEAEILPECIAASNGRINFLPNDGRSLAFHRASPGAVTALWSTTSSMGPQPVIALMRAILAGDMTTAEEIATDLRHCSEPVQPITRNNALFAEVNIQMEKLRFEAAGYCKPGPMRPPYDWMPADLAEASRECGRRWAALCQKKYAPIAKS
jgi:trans-o-hydroxybenzylidenepyruvate hydratase-aldolase